MSSRGARAEGDIHVNRTLTAALLLLAADQALPADDATELNPVIVTATRTAQTADASLAPVTVITRSDLERLQAHSLQDVLTGLPGISITNSGGPGKSTSVFLRGASGTQLLVLIDGIKVGSATTGITAFEQIPVDEIDRIEIVRGPRSSLYGSEAIGGVIQVFTRKGTKALTPSFSVGGGTYDTWQGQGGVSGSAGEAWYSTSLSGFFTNGINACRDSGSPFSGCGANEPDKDGYWNSSGSIRAGYRFDNGAELSADWLRSYSDSKYDGSFQNHSKEVQQLIGASARLPQWGIWQPTFTIGQSEDRSSDYQPDDTLAGRFNTQRNTASWQNDFMLAARQQITAGADYLQDHIVSTTDYTTTSREDIGGFAQYQGGFGNSDVQLSVRGDHNQQFGDHYTGGGAWGYSFGRDLRIVASYGTAFRAPSFNELYFTDPFGDTGNPNLRPEQSRSGELGLSGRPGIWNWALNTYQTNIDDLIASLPPNFVPENVASARIRGVEAQLGAHWNHWRGQFYASYLDARDRTNGDSNHLLPRRAQQTARLDIDRDFHRFNVGSTLNASGRRFDDLGNTQSLGGYATVDLRGGWQIDRCWLLQAQLSNLFDKHYETVQYFNQPGRAVFFTLRYHPVGV
jgi:vitamin B12 transporter